MALENKISINQEINPNDELNLNQLLRVIIREKAVIFLVIFLSTTITTFNSFRVKKIWEGSLDIVVKENDMTKSSNRFIANLPSFINQSSNDEKETQRLILTSPSVLRPVYEFVENYKEKKNPNFVKNKTSFNQWVNGELSIKFKNESSVLSVKYANEDKTLIIDTLDLIAIKYKDYSKRDKIKNIEKTIQFLNSQKSIISEKYLKSQKEFNKFSIENGLGNIDGFVGLGNSSKPLSGNFNSVLEDIQKFVSQDNFINSVNLDQLNQNKLDAGQRFSSQFAKLESYEALYVDLSSKLRPNSEILKALKGRIDNLRSSLKRPNEILLEYRRLGSEAERNEKLLTQIENSLQLAKLQKVRTPNAWEIISVPTISNNPIFPQKKKILFFTLIISSIVGSLIAIFKETLSGLIFELKDYRVSIPFLYIESISKDNEDLNTKLISNFINFKSKNDLLGIIYLSNNFFTNEDRSDILKISKKHLNFEIISSNNISKIDDCKKVILISEPGLITYKNLNNLNKYLSIYKDKILGWFFVDKMIS